MKKINFPYLALGIGLFLMLVIIKGSEPGSDGATKIPLLALLAISEFAFFITAFAAYFGIKHILSVGISFFYASITVFCILLSIRFMIFGIELWPL